MGSKVAPFFDFIAATTRSVVHAGKGSVRCARCVFTGRSAPALYRPPERFPRGRAARVSGKHSHEPGVDVSQKRQETQAED